MKKIILALLTLTHFASAQVIPTTRTTKWLKAGHLGAYPKNIQHLNIMNFGGNGNGTFNNSPALASAIASLSGKAGLIEFPVGNFLFNSTINLPDSIIIRGAGASQTTFTFNLNNAVGDCFRLYGNTVGTNFPVLKGFNKNSQWVKISNASGFKAGDWIEIKQLNGAWNSNPVYWAEYSVGQILKIDSVKGSKIYFKERLRINYDTTLTAHIVKLNPCMSSGIECIKIKRTDSLASSVNYGIEMYYAVNCWVSGVESEKMIGSHILIYRSAHCEVTGCYIHDAYSYDGSSTHGYGITLGGHACEIKVENNIVRHLRHAIVCKEGANGNVIGYNYTLEPNRSEFPSDYGADLFLHGHYPFANLFEGNMSQNIQIDQSWGPSGPWNTFFRNRADGYGILMSSGTIQSDSQNFVGNDITNTSFLKGNYSLNGTNHFQYGNRVKGTVTPSGTTNLTTLSYYLNTSPSWWTSLTPWPSIGMPYSLAGVTIPARDRFLSGSNLTVCNNRSYRIENVTTNQLDADSESMIVYPNPAIDFLNINNTIINEPSLVEIFNINGKLILAEELNHQNRSIDISKLPSGIYGYRIITDKVIFKTGSFIKQ